MRSKSAFRLLAFAAALCMATSAIAAPKLVITLPKTSFVVGEPIPLGVAFHLGRGCWTLNPNVTTLTFRIVVFDARGRRVPDVPQYVMYRLPGCNLAVFCDVSEITTTVFLDNSGPDMYGPFYKLPPGHYRVRAVYDSSDIVTVWQDDEDHYCWDKIFRRDFIKHLESNVVEFEILPADACQEAPAPERDVDDRKEENGEPCAPKK